MAEMTTVEVLKRDAYCFCGPLKDFIAYLQETMRNIPEEYRDAARIEFDASTYYDSIEQTVSVSFARPSTPEESNQRETEFELRRAEERDRLERRLAALMKPRRRD